MKRKKQEADLDVTISGRDWVPEEMAQAKAFAKAHHAQRTPERKLKNQMLSIRYRMEEYIETEKTSEKKVIPLEEFLKEYLKALGLTFKKFAFAIDTTDGNLKKYVSGERKFSTDLAFRFASFFHTTPDLWMRVNIKNELLELKKKKKQTNKYKKYDYEKVLDVA